MKSINIIFLISFILLTGCEHKHDIVIDQKVDPTCTQDGLSEGKHCKTCNKVLVEQTILPMLNHSLSDWIIDADSTKNTIGSKHRYCFNCNETMETDVIPKKQNENEIWDDDVLYNLELVNGKVECTNYDFVVCLTKDPLKDFKVLNLTDIQLEKWETSSGHYVFDNFASTVDYLIKESLPDLITISGDQGYGEKESIIAISALIDSYNIPWAPVFGNHDNECRDLSLKEQIYEYSKYQNCLMKMGPNNIGLSYAGNILYGTYIINIVEVDNDSFNVVRSLYMINGGDNQDYDTEGVQVLNTGDYERNSEEQIGFYAWGNKSANKYKKDENVKNTIIQHMPITAYNVAFSEAFNTSINMYQLDELYEECNKVTLEQSYLPETWNEGYKDSFGVNHDGIYGPPVLDDVFERFVALGNLDSFIVGHDHLNNFCIKYNNVYLTYGLKTGIGCYYEEKLNGGTLLTYNSENDVSIRHIYKN